MSRRQKARGKPFRPATAQYAAPSPEASLCLHFIDEAQLAGWRAIPEYPRSRFDIFLVAEPWCTTAGVQPGTQVGVQAKLEFSTKLMQQLREPLVNQRRWDNPDHIVGLIPQMPSTEAAKKKMFELELLGIGMFTAYDVFNGNDDPSTTRSVNLADAKRLGKVHDFFRRVQVPGPDYPFVLPGSVGGQHWSPWKEKAMALIVEAMRMKEFTLHLFRKHKVNEVTWINQGWIVRVGRREGRSEVYKLNPESPRNRPDFMHPYELERRLKENA